MLELNKDNYYSQQANIDYMSCSQFKEFGECPNKALAKLRGDYVEEKTPALLFGGYVDAYFSSELDTFKELNQDMFNTKTGELKAPYKNIEKVIETIKNDQLFLDHISGENQVIMVGEIGGVPFKIKMDSYFPNEMIVDLKTIKDLDKVWSNEQGKYVDFVERYGYDIQGAIYQEIVRQNTGKTLPFRLAICTKEDVPDKLIIEIDQEYLNKALRQVKDLAPYFQKIKQGLVAPIECGHCDYCKSQKKLTTNDIVKYSKFRGDYE